MTPLAPVMPITIRLDISVSPGSLQVVAAALQRLNIGNRWSVPPLLGDGHRQARYGLTLNERRLKNKENQTPGSR